MKAAVIEKREQPVIVTEVPDPGPVGPDEVLVKVMAAGLCHTYLHVQDGLLSDFGIEVFPLIPGHETVGVIEEAGGEVEHVKRGDRVGVYWIIRAAIAPTATRGRSRRACPG